MIQRSNTSTDIEYARQWCREQVSRHYENFSVTSLFLPTVLRDEYAALYAFCRGADDLADEPDNKAASFTDTESRNSRLNALDNWESMLDDIYHGEKSVHPAFIALEPVIHAHNLDKVLFEKLLNAFRSDQDKDRYLTWSDVREYSSGSADPVGRIVLRLHGYDDPELDRLSDCICTGLQLVNFIQDICSDYTGRGRIYIPQEDLERFNVTEEMLSTAPTTPELRRLVKFECHRAESLLQRGRPLIVKVAKQLSRQLILFHGGGRLALHSIRRIMYDITLRHLKVPRIFKLALLIRAFRGKPL